MDTPNPNILVKINGKSYRCECGCNVFHHPTRDELRQYKSGVSFRPENVYVCNSCDKAFEGA